MQPDAASVVCLCGRAFQSGRRRMCDPRQLWLFPDLAEAPADPAPEPAPLRAYKSLHDEIARLRAKLAQVERHRAWRTGLRGDGLICAPPFTIAQTRVLRQLVACEVVVHNGDGALMRMISVIRSRLREIGLPVTIATLTEGGYYVASGRKALEDYLTRPAGEIAA